MRERMLGCRKSDKEQSNLAKGGIAVRSYSLGGSIRLTVWLQFAMAHSARKDPSV